MNKRLNFAAAALVAIAAVGGAWSVWAPKWPSSKDSEAAASKTTDEPRNEVVLSPEKFASMHIKSLPVLRRRVQEEHTVPGEIEYKSLRRVALKAPVDSVVEKVNVKPGDAVKRGTRLAILTSPDVGMVRADVEKSKSELELANRAFQWADEITGNLEELLEFLHDLPQPTVVEKAFDDKRLGDHRQAVLPAYSRYNLAEKAWVSAEISRKTGSLSEQTVRQRQSAREIAKEQYLAVCEQSRFDASQAREKARQNQTYARQMVDVSQQKLRTLLGEYSVPTPVEAAGEGARLTHFDLIAPFEGTVEERLTSESQRVAEGTVLFIVANIEVLEVSARIYEGPWQAVAPYFNMDSKDRPPLKISVPAVGGEREFEAQVDYVGRMVDAETKAVTLVAHLDNARHEFKPGMFARIKIPAGQATEVLVVPSAALRTHDSQDFVFVEDELEPRKFHRVDVTIGKHTPEGVTIASGLIEGQRVVVEGAFLLKSELLLEPEE